MNPFDAFGDDDDNDEGISDEQDRRRQENGVLSFHAGTEHALLVHVQRQLSDSNDRPVEESGSIRRRKILTAIDDFCFQRHWMMHVGREKGKILQQFLNGQLDNHRSNNIPYTVVELGTYCGYSSIAMADTILQRKCNFIIYTVDVNAQNQAVATQLVELAGLSDHVKFIHLETGEGELSKQLRHAMGRVQQIDFLFVDHAKELYLSDVQQLEQNGFMKAGSAVAADNVVFFQLDEYRRHMATAQEKGVVETKLESDNVLLEYVTRA